MYPGATPGGKNRTMWEGKGASEREAVRSKGIYAGFTYVPFDILNALFYTVIQRQYKGRY